MWLGVICGLEEEERVGKVKVKFFLEFEEKKFVVENDDVLDVFVLVLMFLEFGRNLFCRFEFMKEKYYREFVDC